MQTTICVFQSRVCHAAPAGKLDGPCPSTPRPPYPTNPQNASEEYDPVLLVGVSALSSLSASHPPHAVHPAVKSLTCVPCPPVTPTEPGAVIVMSFTLPSWLPFMYIVNWLPTTLKPSEPSCATLTL